MEPHQRKHGPFGYRDYESYREWLRDEFSFRCAYCLNREQWGMVRGLWDIDHFIPQSQSAEDIYNYDNLIYACRSCNSSKYKYLLPDPCRYAFGKCIQVEDTGEMIGLNEQGKQLIGLLTLNRPQYVSFRGTFIETLQVLSINASAIYEKWMCYPDNLPDLRNSQPLGNTRPEGVQNCFHLKRIRNELPSTY